MEFRFGDEVFTVGDTVKLQTVEQKYYYGFIRSISTRLVENTEITVIELLTSNDIVLINTDEIEFMTGGFKNERI